MAGVGVGCTLSQVQMWSSGDTFGKLLLSFHHGVIISNSGTRYIGFVKKTDVCIGFSLSFRLKNKQLKTYIN